jgi:uncharacterized protein (DUF2147 family)
MKSKLIVCLLLKLLLINNCRAQVKADDIIGIWLTHGKEPAKIQIYKSGEKYYGKIVWLKNSTDKGQAKLDRNNPDKSKRNQPIVELIILKDFSFDTDEWEDGTVYDPENGKTYSCYLALKDRSTLKVRGYVGISLLGRTEIWSKVSP